jgi:hypothetical protein
MAALVNISDKVAAASTTTLTTPGVTPGGSNRAVLVFTIGESSSYATAVNYTNSGGAAINDFTGIDVRLNFASFRFAYGKAFGEIASPTSSTTIYTGFGSTFNGAVSIPVFLQDADQTDPFGTDLASAETALSSGTTTISQAFTGLTSGQLVVGALYIYDFAGTACTYSLNSGTTLAYTGSDQVSADVENSIVHIVAVKGTADGSGNCTLSADVTTTGAAGSMARMYGVPIVGAASGVEGTLTVTTTNDTSAASGTTTILGSLARTTANDTISASGSSGIAVTGTLSRTTNNDTSSASGTTTILGTVSVTTNRDSSVITGTTTIVGSLSRTANNDSMSAFGFPGTVTITNIWRILALAVRGSL